MRVRCGFHLVRLGWLQKIISKRSYPQKDWFVYDSVCDHLRSWIYSWMKGNCESKLEYMVSKLMFFRFLHTSYVKSKLGLGFIESVEKFVREYVEPHERHYCFYLRKHVRHFDLYTTSGHEGTNNGIRHSTVSVGPKTLIENSMVILSENGNRNTKNKILKASKNFHGTKLYTNLTCSQHLVPTASWMLEQNWARQQEYKSIRISAHTWLVIHQKFDPNYVSQEVSTIKPGKPGKKKPSRERARNQILYLQRILD